VGVLDLRVPPCFGLLWCFGDDDLDRQLLLRRRGLLWRCDDLGLCVPLLRYASSSLVVNLLPTILNPCSAARCICSLGSPGLGRVVYIYVCAATSAACGVFGMILPCSSTDRKDESRFMEKLCLSECWRFSTLDPCLRCLFLFVYDASLCALWRAMLAAMAESFLFCISLLSLANCFDCYRKA
jgi:hypothetical protein